MKFFILFLSILTLVSCKKKEDQGRVVLSDADLDLLKLKRGTLALCGTIDLGSTDFSASCPEEVQAEFQLGISLLHSFEYDEAEKAFVRVIEKDPECLMGYWGIAMSNFHELWAPPTKEELVKCSRLLEIAKKIKPKSGRESDYFNAVALYYTNWEASPHKERLQQYTEAMQRIYVKYQNDPEAAIFYALALDASADPTDKTYANQRLAGKILEALFIEKPDHPGIAHYIIHNYDYPELAQMALPTARKYALIAPSSSHALHMPSHIFTRLGLWDESVSSNIQSMEASQCYTKNTGQDGNSSEELHAMDYLVYAYLQQGDTLKAHEELSYLNSIEHVYPEDFKGAFTFGAIPVRIALENRDWQQASQLDTYPRGLPWDDFPWQKAMIHFGRVLGAVHLGDLDAARNDLAVLEQLYDKIDSTGAVYYANLVKVQVLASQAWISYKDGDKEQAILQMTAAADLEESMEKHPVTPGEVLPARELLGDLYMALDMPAKALEAYQQDLQTHPNRFNGVFGAAVAADDLQRTDLAKDYYSQLIKIAHSTPEYRKELKLAKTYLQDKSS